MIDHSRHVDSRGYICRHGKYRDEHWCDDHADAEAAASQRAWA